MTKEQAHEFYLKGKKAASGDGVRKDLIEAESCFRDAAESGDCDAQYELALMSLGICERGVLDEESQIRGSGIDPDPDSEEGLAWLKKSAEGGCVKAQTKLGLVYLGFEGDLPEEVYIEEDVKEGLKWLELASENGDAVAQNTLGFLYRNGVQVEKNLVKAARMFSAAADSGLVEAMSNLSELYLTGEGVDQDTKKAVQLLMKSYRYGNNGLTLVELYKNGVMTGDQFSKFLGELDGYHDSDALMSIGEMYHIGECGDVDFTKAFECYKKVADHGPYPDKAYCKIAAMYEDGEGVPKSREKAIEYYETAAVRFHSIEAKAALKRLKGDK